MKEHQLVVAQSSENRTKTLFSCISGDIGMIIFFAQRMLKIVNAKCNIYYQISTSHFIRYVQLVLPAVLDTTIRNVSRYSCCHSNVINQFEHSDLCTLTKKKCIFLHATVTLHDFSGCFIGPIFCKPQEGETSVRIPR